MPEDLAAEHRDAAVLAGAAGRALLELRASPPTWVTSGRPAIIWPTVFS